MAVFPSSTNLVERVPIAERYVQPRLHDPLDVTEEAAVTEPEVKWCWLALPRSRTANPPETFMRVVTDILENLRIPHLGEHLLDAEELGPVGSVVGLFTPVGGETNVRLSGLLQGVKLRPAGVKPRRDEVRPRTKPGHSNWSRKWLRR